MEQESTHEKISGRLLIISAWFSIILVSDMPDILFKSISGQIPSWLPWGKTGVVLFFSLLCILWKQLKPMRPFSLVLLAFFLALRVSAIIQASGWWTGILTTSSPSFTVGYLKLYLLDTGVMAVVLISLWILKGNRSEFFLVKGQTGAPIEPVRWLGIRRGETWATFGWIFAVIAALGVAVPTLVAMNPPLKSLLKATAYLPASLFFAALNAFNEEIYFRVLLLATLPGVIGRKHTLMINVVFFGLAHYLYGSPPGVTGFLLTGFLAWILGKSILETRGIFWAWFIHFLPDLMIFSAYAVDWVRR